jgi:hypothetical protein
MQATAGDIIRLRGSAKGQPDRTGCVIDARGAGGGPPYLVRFTDGRVSLIYEGSGGLVERPASRVSAAVARTSSVRPRPRPPAYLPARLLLVVLAIPAFAAFAIVRGVNGNVPGAGSLLITLAAIAVSVPVVMLSRRLERRIPSRRWRVPVRLLLAGMVLAAQTLAMLWLGSVYNDHQRCIDSQTMTVIPSAACQGQAGQPGPTGPRWYTGGTGLRPGDLVEGGSFAPPASNGDQDGSGSGVSGDTGGDDGDSGGDAGGGEGGGDG